LLHLLLESADEQKIEGDNMTTFPGSLFWVGRVAVVVQKQTTSRVLVEIVAVVVPK